MQGEEHHLKIDFEVLHQLFSTPRTEVTPWSDVVGEEFKQYVFHHSSYRSPGSPLSRLASA